MKLSRQRVFTLLQRELREYRTSLVWTPLVCSLILALLMLGSVLLVNRISMLGDGVIQIIEQESRGVDGGAGESGWSAGGALLAPGVDYQVSEEAAGLPEEAWNFAMRWQAAAPEWLQQNISLRTGPQDGADSGGVSAELQLEMDGLNPVLLVLHNILLLVLFITTTHYLLSALFDDRKDRSILFWRSLPVNDWETVLTKFAVALLAAPAIVLVISALLQIVYVLLAMLLLWRVDASSVDAVLANVSVGPLLADQLGGWVVTALWIAPAYAWLLLASAAARRSPFLLATAPVLALLLLDQFVLRSGAVLPALVDHLPHLSENSSMGFHLFGPNWAGLDLVQLVLGLVFTAACLTGAVYLRRHRWEI